MGSPISEERRSLSRKYVIVEGTVDPRDRGHEGLFAGELRDIQRIDATLSRAEIERVRGLGAARR
jgi:hypothetical protein